MIIIELTDTNGFSCLATNLQLSKSDSVTRQIELLARGVADDGVRVEFLTRTVAL